MGWHIWQSHGVSGEDNDEESQVVDGASGSDAAF